MSLRPSMPGFFNRVRQADTGTTASPTALSATEPVGEGVIELPAGVDRGILGAYGNGVSGGGVINYYITGWRFYTGGLWIPCDLVSGTFTLTQSTIVGGIAGSLILDTASLSSSVSITTPEPDASSMVGFTLATVDFALRGFRKIQIDFNSNSHATTINGLIDFYRAIAG